jgi:Fe(3+) dicitrate transport protein
VRGIETRFSQGVALGDSWHELGIGYRYINEAGHELRYREPTSSNLPTTDSRNDRDTRGSTEAMRSTWTTASTSAAGPSPRACATR